MKHDDVYSELKEMFNREKSKNNISLFPYVILLIVLFIPLIVISIKWRPYSFVSSFDNLPDPKQTPFSWWTMISVFWKNLMVDFLASYDINWKVIAIKDFDYMSDFSVKISPRDFVLWWWFMWVQENIDKFFWNDGLNDMILSASVKSENADWLDSVWWLSVSQKKYSNNCLIPCDMKTRFLLSKIIEWDDVRIKWYLAYIYLDDGSWHWWPSSMSREDRWCEIIYVTDVTWLKEI